MTFRILEGDCRSVLAALPAESVQCVVTSPPYYGLRDYGVIGQLGLEKTPAEYIAKMVEVFREVSRVLRNDGTLWLNIGDSYASDAGKCRNPGGGENSMGRKRKEHGAHPLTRPNLSDLRLMNLKGKDLIGIPWMLAFALRAEGWYLRSDIIWHKPNPMPESVADRPTKSHEYLFLLTKSDRYYYDAEAIREPLSDGSVDRLSQPNLENQPGSDRAHAGAKTNGRMKAVKRSGNLERKHRQDYGGSAESTARQGFAIPWNSDGSHRPQYRRALELAAEHGLTEAHIDAIRACGITDNGKNSQVQNGAGRNTPENLRLAAEAKAVLGGYYREFMATGGRNKRTVWTVTTQPYKDAHFATFPPKLIEPCILAGAPGGGGGSAGSVQRRRHHWPRLLSPRPRLHRDRAQPGIRRHVA